MIILPGHSKGVLSVGPSNTRHGERGAALAIALLMMMLLSAVALGVLAVVQGEAKIAGSDLKRTEACYASAAAIEIMTNDFSALFAHTSRPTTAELDEISDNPSCGANKPAGCNQRRLHLSRSRVKSAAYPVALSQATIQSHDSLRPVCRSDRRSHIVYD